MDQEVLAMIANSNAYRGQAAGDGGKSEATCTV